MKTDLEKTVVKPHQSAESVSMNVQADNRCKSADSFSEHCSRITNLFVPKTNCSGERSSSKLKRTKNELRSTMHQERLNRLEHEVLREIELRELADRPVRQSQISKNSDLQLKPESRLRLPVIILDVQPVPLGLGLGLNCDMPL